MYSDKTVKAYIDHVNGYWEVYFKVDGEWYNPQEHQPTRRELVDILDKCGYLVVDISKS